MKKEFKIGEVFQFGLVKLKCIEENKNPCEGCYLNLLDCCGFQTHEYIGFCTKLEREDKTSVIFVKVEE